MSEHPPSLGLVAQRLLTRIGGNRSLDPFAEAVEAAVATGVRRLGLRDVMRGTWLGHALHPLLTDFTAGAWMAASFLDLFGPKGSSSAARRLVGLGLIAAVPTLVSGFADWEETEGPQRRVGLLHAGTSSLATFLYFCSFLTRCKGKERTGVILGLLGGVVAFWDGYLGGDLALVGRVGEGRRLGPETGRRPGGRACPGGGRDSSGAAPRPVHTPPLL
ncbi:MAG: (2Fe-2S)-binding protein [Actinomycetota bacterium]|nr:(2Fe-2S)-binding protein [Actinomycetota bacterium]